MWERNSFGKVETCEMDDDKIQVAFQTRLGEQFVRMTSTLVETVSINYEDFNESFLTCGTCLCTYDGGEHTPKLLVCSHTVCLQCLGRIAASAVQSSSTTAATASTSSSTSLSTPRDTSTFRCPICRELITVPRGGVAALPPSFLVNQLLDLMGSQRREVIPKCSTHSNQELLFCETCDSVFCAACVSSPHTSSQAGDHTVIPFSIAIKRMSEILLYKANECLAKLDEAGECVSDEILRLDEAAEIACDVAAKAFEDASKLLERRRQTYIAKIKEVATAKRDKLKEQLELIEKERAKVRDTCDGDYQVDVNAIRPFSDDNVRYITKRISELSSQLDSFVSLCHPRENAYLLCKTQSDLISLETAVSTDIHTSTTFPPLCTVDTRSGALLCAGLEVEIILETRDYHNQPRKEGGDPVKVIVSLPSGPVLPENQIFLEDNEDGTFIIKFRPLEPGTYVIKVTIFGRPIKDDDFPLQISQHNNPIKVWGRGELCQPVSVSRSKSGELFVLDTGNARIVVLDQLINLKRVFENDALKGRSCTGITYCCHTDSVLVVNWRSKQVTRMSPNDGSTVATFTHAGFVEPIGISVDGKGNIYVCDNGARTIFIFDSEGKHKNSIKRDNFGLLGGVAIAPDNKTVVVADMSLFIISNIESGQQQLDREVKVSGKGRFGGVVVDSDGVIIATRTEKTKSFIQVFKDNMLISTIDSFNSKLKRPSDITVVCSGSVLVADLGSNLIKLFKYK